MLLHRDTRARAAGPRWQTRTQREREREREREKAGKRKNSKFWPKCLASS